MLNIHQETLISLTEAARSLPAGRGCKPVDPSCILRWIQRGLKVKAGPTVHTVRLEGIRAGGRWLTSREALQRFFENITPQLGSDQSLPRTAAERRAADAYATKQLAAQGIF